MELHKSGIFQSLGNKPSLYVSAENVCAVFSNRQLPQRVRE